MWSFTLIHVLNIHILCIYILSAIYIYIYIWLYSQTPPSQSGRSCLAPVRQPRPPPCDCRASAARCVSLYFSSIVHQTHSIRNTRRAALGSNIDKNFKFEKSITNHEYVFWNFGGWVWAQRLNTHPFYNDLDLKQILALEHVGT